MARLYANENFPFQRQAHTFGERPLLRLHGSDCEDLVNRDGCGAEKREGYGVARRISARATERGHLHGSVGGVHYPEFLRTRRHCDDPLPVDFGRRIRRRQYLDDQDRRVYRILVGL